eukprot:SAG22_NODE_5278_length_1047_cov_1.844937_1_plen_257_part_10
MINTRTRMPPLLLLPWALPAAWAAAPEPDAPEDERLWKNVPFLQGRGPGWAALATPWRLPAPQPGARQITRPAYVPGAAGYRPRRAVYIADPGEPGQLVLDGVWGSVYNPSRMRPGPAGGQPVRALCDSTDGPGCMALQRQYASATAAGVSLNVYGETGGGKADGVWGSQVPGWNAQQQFARSKHGKSPLAQLFPPAGPDWGLGPVLFARRRQQPRVRAGKPSGGEVGRRLDPADGYEYNRAEFTARYGDGAGAEWR